MEASNLSYPQSLIRLSSTMFSFQCPTITGKGRHTDFLKSFRTMGTCNPDLQTLIKSIHSSRDNLMKALTTMNDNQTIVKTVKPYIHSLHQLLITCSTRPTDVRLDERLVFEWDSGIEKKKRPYKSEVMTYELVMSIVTEAIATMGIAMEECCTSSFTSSYSIIIKKEKYAAACRQFKQASGIFAYLEQSMLPQWIELSKQGQENQNDGTVSVSHIGGVNKKNMVMENDDTAKDEDDDNLYMDENDDLPSEARIGYCQAFRILTLGMAQQMAIATLLMTFCRNNKGGTTAAGSEGNHHHPNWSLLAKLSLGVADQFKTFVQIMKGRKLSIIQSRLDPNLFSMVTFQIKIQTIFSLYFHARHYWEQEMEYGVAIAMIYQAISMIRSMRNAIIDKRLEPAHMKETKSMMKHYVGDMREHMETLLQCWERDNSSIYFATVPISIPTKYMLKEGTKMMKSDLYVLEEVDPILL